MSDIPAIGIKPGSIVKVRIQDANHSERVWCIVKSVDVLNQTILEGE